MVRTTQSEDILLKLQYFFTLVAVWPGWGHASENPLLPTTLKEKGIQVNII